MFTENREELIKILLSDMTSRKNIIFANNGYEGFKETDYITYETYLELKDKIVPRAFKKEDTQKERAKSKAEIFTPSDIVYKMNNNIDEEIKDFELFDYVSYRWLEITCGEGAYITSRYNAPDGVTIPIEERVGFLDKKLERISRDVHNKKEWADLAIIALTSCYGFEFQGDSLFLARLNMLHTVQECYFSKFKEMLDMNTLLNMATVISYNVFQMDGLKYVIPFTDKYVIVKDWSDNSNTYFKDIGGLNADNKD